MTGQSLLGRGRAFQGGRWSLGAPWGIAFFLPGERQNIAKRNDSILPLISLQIVKIKA
jgi:hypothetical protein